MSKLAQAGAGIKKDFGRRSRGGIPLRPGTRRSHLTTNYFTLGNTLNTVFTRMLSPVFARRFSSTRSSLAQRMNRPRNRQPRAPRADGRGGTRGGRGGGRANTNTFNHAVPSTRHVVPGATVSIVLKQDQPTGREVQGVVQDLLTRGDHPRGIKVRLQDGRVGRVQRMSENDTASKLSLDPPRSAMPSSQRQEGLAQDHRMEGPPPRTLADFLPPSNEEDRSAVPASEVTFSTATAKCPICGLFEGDEIAVSRHVEQHFA